MIRLTDEGIRDALYQTKWEVIEHKRKQYPHTKMNAHALYVNNKMFGYVLDKPEKQDWFSIYKGDREYAHSTIAKHTLDEAKQALLDMAIIDMRLPSERGKIAKAQLKKVVEWGDEPCYIHLVKDGAVNTTEGIKRRECSKCWQALLEEVK